jgi:transposase InsO family protein
MAFLRALLAVNDWLCDAVIGLHLRCALAVETHRRRTRRGAERLHGSLQRLFRAWRLERGRLPFAPCARHPWNRTPAHVEEKVVRLHVEQPRLGAGQLMRLCERVLAFRAARETVRRILIRRRELIVELEHARRRRPRRIRVSGPGRLWRVDLTLVWVLGFFPVWVLGAVDYHGSRLVVLERVRWPSSAEVVRVLEAAFARHSVPERLLSDRGPAFTSGAFAVLMAEHGIRHVLIRPAHPWTNGRIERMFRTFKETVFGCIWLFASRRQVERYCADFLLWYNRDRPHSSWGGRTPDEVFSGRPMQRRPLGRVAYFDGHLRWWRFGPAG